MFRPEVTYDSPLINVVGESFCFPYLVDLNVRKKIARLSEAQYEVLDDNGNLLLLVEGSIWQFNKKRIIRDSSGLPILTMRGKVFKFRQRWTIHRGESKDVNDLLYTVQESSFFQLKSQFDVFLANNLTENNYDFRLTGSYFTESFTLHKGDQLIAQVKEKVKFGCLVGKRKFEVRVYPGIDYVFVVSLLVILSEIDSGDGA